MKYHITTNMRGFQRWMRQHPRKKVTGYFSFGGRELTHNEIVKIVNYAVEKGYETDADIPADEIMQFLEKPICHEEDNVQ